VSTHVILLSCACKKWVAFERHHPLYTVYLSVVHCVDACLWVCVPRYNHKRHHPSRPRSTRMTDRHCIACVGNEHLEPPRASLRQAEQRQRMSEAQPDDCFRHSHRLEQEWHCTTANRIIDQGSERARKAAMHAVNLPRRPLCAARPRQQKKKKTSRSDCYNSSLPSGPLIRSSSMSYTRVAPGGTLVPLPTVP
jgi:hypothetical protein